MENRRSLEWTCQRSHRIQLLHFVQLAAQTPHFLFQLSFSGGATPERALPLELVLDLSLLQVRLQLVHLWTGPPR